MLTISKALSASQVQPYHREKFTNARANYYSNRETMPGTWRGKLAEQWALRHEVGEEQFVRLTNGQNPTIGEQLVRHMTARHT